MKALPASLALALLGCGPAHHSRNTLAAPGTFVITAEQIAKSGAQNAWQVLQRAAPMLLAQNDKDGRPAKLTRRGRSSLVLDDAPAVLLDGVRMADFHNLDMVGAQSIRSIAIVDGVEATTYYGTNSGNGVILIKTKDGSEP
jgi:TonB-dependent starch-binding outer membrane protein SusC